MAIGTLDMTSEDIVEKNKGQAIEVIQFMNDSVWGMRPV